MLAYPVRARLSRARARFEQQVRDTLFGGAPSWRRKPNTLPWFDRPDALAQIDRASPDAPVLEKWVRDGYAVLDDCVDPADIDEMIATLDGLWDAPAPIPDLVLLDLRDSPDAP